jgi:transposase
VVAAEVSATTNDQPHFVPMATAAGLNLTRAGHPAGVGVFLADAGYWTAANATADVGAPVLIATRKTAWRRADKPDEDKLAVLAKVNRGELSQRKAGEILGVSYTWVRDMTKRYFGTEGQRITRHAEPDPDEWLPVVERVARGELSKRAAADQLDVSNSRIDTMLAHIRGAAVDPAIARQQMDTRLAESDNAAAYKKRQHTIEPVFGNIKANLGYRRFARRGLPAVNSEWRLICSAHNLLKLRQARLA